MTDRWLYRRFRKSEPPLTEVVWEMTWVVVKLVSRSLGAARWNDQIEELWLEPSAQKQRLRY